MSGRPQRNDTERLRDIVDAADSIRGDLLVLEDGQAPEQIVMEAIKYNLVAIGEAATHLSDDIRRANQDVDWAAIKGLRNILAHEYFRVNHELIRKIAKEDVPLLATRVGEIVNTL